MIKKRVWCGLRFGTLDYGKKNISCHLFYYKKKVGIKLSFGCRFVLSNFIQLHAWDSD